MHHIGLVHFHQSQQLLVVESQGRVGWAKAVLREQYTPHQSMPGFSYKAPRQCTGTCLERLLSLGSHVCEHLMDTIVEGQGVVASAKKTTWGPWGTDLDMGVLLLGSYMAAATLQGACVPHLSGLHAQALLQHRQQVQRQAALAAHVAQLRAMD